MAQNYNFLMDPSLPLEEQSLLNLPPPLPSRQVRFLPDPQALPDHPHHTGDPMDLPDHHHQDSAVWQVDGSNHSLASDKTTTSFQAAYTMREYDDQLNTLKKENFNLKLRIYFMEERLGLLHAPREQENIYRVNIDLKVHSEELKKDLAEKATLLSQAAQALQSQEEKYKARIDNLNARLGHEKERRVTAEKEAEEVRMEVKDLRDQKDGERRISDESKLLYAEAFGSINLGLGRSENDVTKNDNMEQNEWEKQTYELTDMVAEKNKVISDLEIRNADLIVKVREMNDMKDARFEVIEFKQKFEEVLRGNQKMKMETENSQGIIKEYEKRMQDNEYVVKDCNVYIDSLTEQLNEKTEEIEKMTDKLQNSSTIQGRDEEIASLQAELALHHDQQQRLEQMEMDLGKHQTCEDRIENLEMQLVNQKTFCSDLQSEMDSKTSNIEQLEKDLVIAKDHFKTVPDKMDECNNQISHLKSELEKRNSSILGFVKMLTNIKDSLKNQGSPDYMINGDIFDIEATDVSWDHGFDNILEPTKNLIEKLLDDNLEKSKLLNDQNQQDQNGHIKYLNDRCSDLENILAEKHNVIADLSQNERDLSDLQTKLHECEKEQCEMQTYINTKLSEMKKMRQELSTQKDTNSVNESKLQKAISAIQGFVTENLKLSQEINTLNDEKDALVNENQNKVKTDDVLCLENERLRAEVETLTKESLEASAKTMFMERGIEKARANFAGKLGEYRGKFDCVVSGWRAGKEACELMRLRLEELADFLQQLLDMEGEGGDLNLSCLSLDMRESLQRSIDESRLLSASILASQTSMLQEMSMVGLQIGEEDQMEELDQEKWTVPEVEVSVFEEKDEFGEAGETVAKSEYDALLLELRDNLRKRRFAEEELEKMREKYAIVDEQKFANVEQLRDPSDGSEIKSKSKSKLPVIAPVSDNRGRSLSQANRKQLGSSSVDRDILSVSASKESRGRSGSRVRRSAEGVEGHLRRKTLTKIPGPLFGDEEDCWSEPDKEESRRRIGLESDLSGSIGHGRDVGKSHRTTDDEIIGGEIGTELRRERGRVERLRGDLVNAGRKEKELCEELATAKEELVVCKDQLEKSKKELVKSKGTLEKIEMQRQQIEGESEQLRKELEKTADVEREKLQLEHRVKQGDEVIEKLNKGIQWWEEECKKIKLELEKGDVEAVIEKEIGAKNKEIKKLTEGLNRYEVKCKQMIDQYDNLTKEARRWKLEADTKGRESEQSNEEIKVLAEDIKKYEEYCDKMKEEYELLQKEVDKWKGLAVEKKRSEDVTNLMSKYETEMQKIKSEFAKKKIELDNLKGTNSKLEERCVDLEEILKINDAKIFEVEEKVRILTYEVERKDKSIASKDENLSIAECLLKELHDSKKEMEKHLENASSELKEHRTEMQSVKASFEKYKKEYNDEITQNKVNEIEIKMKHQAEGIKKFAEEILKIEQKSRMTEKEKQKMEVELKSKVDTIKASENQIHILKETVDKEKYQSEELGKTIENLRNNVQKLETEKMLKESLEIEFRNLQKNLVVEKEVQQGLNDKIVKLEKSKRLIEDRCLSAEKVLKTISADSFSVDKENQKSNLSKLELETVLHHSRPTSRRQGLSSLDHNTSSALTTSIPSTTPLCCSHWADLEQVKLERDAALSKLASTRSSLATTAEKLSLSNRRKKQVEKAICQQLTKTHEVLKKTKANLENVGGDNV
eukprot:GFUD01001199.1.p1 GENE.GFUD01001199.1~~GFUD01001199.1.p1  ORF type:complete len:1705 (-),score=626.81 GFUD01001199.1:124-5238(-)